MYASMYLSLIPYLCPNRLIVIQNPEGAVRSACRLSLTCSAPRGWKPGAPLLPHRPPYPTEDLIRQSGLFALMASKTTTKINTKTGAETETETQEMTEKEFESSKQQSQLKQQVPSKRRKTGADKAKLLDLDLNPDM
jgi:hypothetical protein